MLAEILNIAEPTESNVSIDQIDNTTTADCPGSDSHSWKSTDNADSNLNAETVDVSEENKEKKDVSFGDADKSTFKRKYRNFLDSDSEEDDNVIASFLNKSKTANESIGASEPSRENVPSTSDSAGRRKKSRRIVGSDSDEDNTPIETSMGNDSDDEIKILGETASIKRAKSRFHMLVDSDSDDNDEFKNHDTPNINHRNETPDESEIINVEEKKNKAKFNTIIDVESEYDNSSIHSSPAVKKKKQTSRRKKNAKAEKLKEKSRFNTLIDTDSEDDTERRSVEQSFNEENENDISEKKSGKTAKKRTGSVRAAKDEAMRQIHSETQRLIRSSAVSLPYHVPKQRSLQDFLNRKKLIPALPEGLTKAAKVKMSSQIVGKVLEEKEKEAELFYKSSDSEDETINCVPASENPVELDSCSLVDEIVTGARQNIISNDAENTEKKSEIIHEDGIEIGVSRKLFIEEPQVSTVNEKSAETRTNVNDNEESLGADSTIKTRETEQRDVDDDARKKLFNSDYDEGVDSPPKDSESSIIVINDSPSFKPLGYNNAELENFDEGIHSLGKINEISSFDDCDGNDFVLKFHDSELTEIDNSPEIDASITKNLAKESTELSSLAGRSLIVDAKRVISNDEEKSSKNRQDSAEITEIDDDNSNEPAFGHVYGLPPPDIDEKSSASRASSIRSKLLTGLSNVEPKLRGSPGMIIDLNDDPRSNEEGVKTLVDRFLRHSTVKKSSNQVNCPITILHTEKTSDGVRLIEEILPYKLPINDSFTEKELQKPGAKYKRLRMDLIEKMAKKRGEEWRLKEQREKDKNCDDIVDDEDDEDEEAYVKLADDEFHSGTESEPDEEEDDARFEKPKKRKPREFADEEAEVSGEEEDDDDDDDEEEDEEEEEEENENEDKEVIEVSDEEEAEEDEEENISLRVNPDDDTDDNSSFDEESTLTKTPRRARIIKAFEDDSNSQQEPTASVSGVEHRGKLFERTKTDVDMFDPDNDKDRWSSDAEAEFPPSQILPRDQADARSQLCKTPLASVNVLRFVSPITQLTALNSYNESPKYSPASNDVSRTSQRVTDTLNDKTPCGVKESPISCDNDKRFGFQKKLFEDPSGTVNDEELMGLCSGKFTSIESDEKSSLDARIPVTSSSKVTETQLLGLCSGSFTSPKHNLEKYEDNSQDTRLSDELENRGKSKIMKKKKVQRLNLSDDEELSNEAVFEDTRDSAENSRDVDYDSEENEIVVVPKRDMKKAAADFLEAEAELSEDDWASEDEDENDLDRLEFEEGDAEEIDENQMRDQLGKLHMRQIQDDDQREVRMLQELLFEDGDLHTDGSGRERKFRWKNIDQLGDDEKLGPRNNDGDENGDPFEEENDLEWRKERIEREKFIEDKMKLSTDEVIDELAVDSQVFKLGIKALKRINSSQNSRKEPEPAVTKPIVPLTVLDLVTKQTIGQNTRIIHRAVTRGSFLARGDECLARLAVHIKQSSESTIVTRKNKGNFVFTHMSPSTEEMTENDEKDETIEDSSANSKTRKRKSAAGVTPRSTKKAKLDVARTTGKKLF